MPVGTNLGPTELHRAKKSSHACLSFHKHIIPHSLFIRHQYSLGVHRSSTACRSLAVSLSGPVFWSAQMASQTGRSHFSTSSSLCATEASYPAHRPIVFECSNSGRNTRFAFKCTLQT